LEAIGTNKRHTLVLDDLVDFGSSESREQVFGLLMLWGSLGSAFRVMRRGRGTYGSGLPMLLVVVLERFDGPVSGCTTERSTLIDS
jgi:hypothetical protein